MADLLELAARVEAATGPDEELFFDIWRQVFPKPTRIWEDEDREEWTAEYADWQNRQHVYWNFVEVDAWLDAAMTLVPERCWAEGSLSSPAMIEIHALASPRSIGLSIGRTPALALTAACLRARATPNPTSLSQGEK